MGMKIENFRHLPDSEKWDYVEKVLDSLLTDITAINAELTKTNTDIDANIVKMTAVNTDLDANVVKMTAVNTDLDANVTKMTAVNTDLDAVATQITAGKVDLNVIFKQLKYQCLSSPALGKGTGNTMVSNVTSFNMLLNGAFQAVAITNFSFTSTTHDVATGFAGAFLVIFDSTGVGTMKVSPFKTTGTAAIASLPTCPATKTPVGYFTLKASATTAFDATTTTLGAAGLTLAWVNRGVFTEKMVPTITVPAVTMTAPAVTMTAPAVTMTAPAVTMDAATIGTTT